MKYFNCPNIFKDGESLDYLVTGFFFKSDNDLSTNYVVSIKEINEGSNCKIEIYEVGCIQDEYPEINTGDEVATYQDQYSEKLCDLELWGKYFFTTHTESHQQYYDDKTHYGGKHKTDSVISLAEAINFGIKKGLEIAKIKPY